MGWAIYTYIHIYVYIIMIQDGGSVANGQARKPQGCASPSAITKVKYYPCQRLIWMGLDPSRPVGGLDEWIPPVCPVFILLLVHDLHGLSEPVDWVGRSGGL